MTIEETVILNKKAKTREDGIYSHKGYLWVVRNKMFVAFSDYYGNCYQRFGSLNGSIGKVDRSGRKEALKKWLLEQK